MSYLEIALLALIQGAAELLPVSSSAHVILVARLLGRDPSSPEMTFLIVMLHTGTMFAVLVYYWPRWRQRLSAQSANRWRLPLMTLLATAVTGVVGLGLLFLIERVVFVQLLGRKGKVEELFGNLPMVAAALFASGVLILLAGSRENRAITQEVSPRSAFWIGLIQALCIPFRGFSRSGATISTALLRGVSRSLAEDFSFALALLLTPPAIVRLLLRLRKAHGEADLSDLLMPGLFGMVCSFLAGLVALRFLSAMLDRGRWKYFGYYCLAAAAVVAIAAMLLPHS
jgi:undecaprenyl-diphosphatase